MTAPPEGVEVDQIEFPAGKVRYYTAGTQGPPIVLLHGGGPDNALLSWRHAIGVLAADHRVYAPDLPGQGGSTEWRGRANQRTFEEVLRWLLDAWKVPQATLVGLSMGGSVAAGFTLRHPQRVRALALVDSTGMQHRMPHHLMTYLLLRADFSGRTAAKLLRGNRALVRTALNKVFFADASTVTDLESLVDEVSAEAAARRSVFADWHADSINRRSMSINHLPQLNRITCPVTVIHGEKDALIPVSSAHEIAGAIPGAQLRIMPNAGHWPNRERPAEFNALLREFVNAVNTPAPPKEPAPAESFNGPAARDETTEAPTQLMKVPSTPATEPEQPADADASTDAPTRFMKVGPTADSDHTAKEEPGTAGAGEKDSPDTTATEAEAESGGTTEASTAALSTEADTTEDSSDTEDSTGTEEPAAEEAPQASPTSDEKPAGECERKATTDSPTRFIKVDSLPEDDTTDADTREDADREADTREDGTTTDTTGEGDKTEPEGEGEDADATEADSEQDQDTEQDSAKTDDADEPAKDDEKDSGDKPTT